MSQPKNENLVLVLALLIALGLVGGFIWWFNQLSGGKIGNLLPPETGNLNSPKPGEPLAAEHISFGERSLIAAEIQPAKETGLKAISARNWSEAVTNLEVALRQNRNDPETLIFLNNAKIGNQKSYSIAASVPLSSDPNGALEILRGIAQAQTEINTGSKIKGIPLKVAIANDENNPEVAQQVAAELVNNPNILGVVGPYASDVTLAAGKVYDSGKLVAISPISSSVKLSGFSPYIFRTVPSDYVAARALANYMLTKLQQQNAAVFFNSQSGYSQSLKSEFVTAVSLGGGQVSSEFDLSNPGFSAAKSVNQAIAQGAKVLMLAANTGTLDKALQVVQVNQNRLSLLGGDDVYTPKTLEVGENQAVGMVIAVPWDIDSNPKSDFPRQSKQLWGAEVNWRTALAYDATVALIAALERSPTRTGVQETLSSANFSTPGASGIVRFLPSGDRNAPVQLVKIITSNRPGVSYDFVPVPQ